jgi:acetate kinase
MTDTVLCINAGSSSLKFKLFEALADGGLSVSIEGQLDGIGVKPLHCRPSSIDSERKING